MRAGPLAATFVLPLLAQAWIPGHDKQIFDRDGVDLFNTSSLYEAGLSKRWLNGGIQKIRGVNLGSQFIVENWMASTVFSGFGCNSKSEFDCVSSLNDQSKADSDFQGHWASWVSPQDFANMKNYGLNTVRIPVGYWFLESLVDSSEHFPRGGEAALDQVIGWAKDAGLYTIISFHGLPGGQAADAFTGQVNPALGFYDNYNYNRAYKWLQWMTNKIHTNGAYGNVGMLLIANEPVRGDSRADDMRKTYYPGAWSAIRSTERSLNVDSSRQIHIQMMDGRWGSGDPEQYLQSDHSNIAFDDHQYVKYTSAQVSHQGYLDFSCNDDRSGPNPVIVGEWSLSPNSDVEHTPDWDPSTNVDFYQKWFAAQVKAYEKNGVYGWCFWSWKTSGLNDPRWDYQLARNAGIIPGNLNDVSQVQVC